MPHPLLRIDESVDLTRSDPLERGEDSLKPLNVSQSPSTSSQMKNGITATPRNTGPRFAPRIVRTVYEMRIGAPMIPSAGRGRGTSLAR